MEPRTPTEIIETTRSHRERAEAFLCDADKLDTYTARSYLAAAQVCATLALVDALTDTQTGATIGDTVGSGYLHALTRESR